MKLNTKYYAKRISSNQLSQFVEVHNESFNSKLTTKQQELKFNINNVSNIEYLGYLIYSNLDEPVSYYGVYPLYAQLNSKKILISQSGDTMTKANHVGYGLFISSAKMTYELCIENNVKAVFGFPSSTSYPTFLKKLNWKFLEELSNFRFIVPVLPLSFLSEKLHIIQPIYRIWVNFILLFYKKGEYFEGSITKNGQNGIHRDKSFWDYKMKAKNNYSLKISDCNVVFKINGRIGIGDIDVSSSTNIKKILFKLKIFSFLTFNTHIMFSVSPGTLLETKLSNIKFKRKGLPIGFLNFTNDVDISNLKYTYFDFDTF